MASIAIGLKHRPDLLAIADLATRFALPGERRRPVAVESGRRNRDHGDPDEEPLS